MKFAVLWLIALTCIIAPGCRSTQKIGQTLQKLEAALTDSTLVTVERYAQDTILPADTLNFSVSVDTFFGNKWVAFEDSLFVVAFRLDTAQNKVHVQSVKKQQRIKGFKQVVKTTVSPPPDLSAVQLQKTIAAIANESGYQIPGWLIAAITFLSLALFAYLRVRRKRKPNP